MWRNRHIKPYRAAPGTTRVAQHPSTISTATKDPPIGQGHPVPAAALNLPIDPPHV